MAISAPAEALLDQGMRLHKAGHFGDAETVYLRLLKSEPDHEQAVNLLGVLYLTGERPKDAVKWLSRRLKRAPQDSLARLNLGKAFLSCGEAFKAVQTLQPLCSANPGFADAAICMARAEHKRGRTTIAGEVLERLAGLSPTDPAALTELANHHLITGNPKAAEAVFRQVIEVQPDNIHNYGNLAAALQTMNRPDDAEVVLNEASALDATDHRIRFLLALNIALKGDFRTASGEMARLVVERPDDLPASASLADILSHDNRTEDAEAHLTALIDSGVDDADIWHNYGVICLQLGKTDIAAEAHRRSLKLKPESGSGWRHLAAIKKFQDRDPDLSRMLEIAKRPDISGENRMHLDYAISKAFDDVGKTNRSFEHLSRASMAKRATFEFDIAAHEAFVDKLIAATPEPFDPPGGSTGSGPIFIVGMPRSGTTLAEQILASHPEVAAGGELMELRKAVAEHCPDHPEAPSDDEVSRICEQYLENTRRFYGSASRLTDKLPENALRCGLIARAFPDARIIHCRRDPLDVSLSCFQRLFSGLQPFTYDLEELGRYHVAHNRLADHWRRVLPGRFHDFDYEALINDQEGETRRLLTFAGLDWNDDCLAFHRTRRSVRTASATQVRQPIYRSSLQRWKPYETHLAPLIKILRDAGQIDD